jgi:hypothetical protein
VPLTLHVCCFIFSPPSTSIAKARGPPRDKDNVLNISVQDISRIEVSSSTNTTPRDSASITNRSDGSPSDPSGSSFDVTGSDVTGSISFNSDDDF